MLARLGDIVSSGFRRTAPDPFILAVLLTFVTFILALLMTETTFPAAVSMWAGDKGLWSVGMLRFAMQMCLILITGHALASSPPMAWVLSRLANLPKTPGQALLLVSLGAMILALVNWGLGLIAGAILARRVGAQMDRKGVKVHYPLLAGAGYLGLMVWHGGFSGTAPLKVTKASDLSDTFAGPPPIDPIPLTQTILSPMNLVITGGLVLIAPLVVMLLHPRGDGAIRTACDHGVMDLAGPARAIQDASRKALVPRLLEDTPIVTILLAGLMAWWAAEYYFPRSGPSGVRELTPDAVNMTMLMLGLILHGTPMRYLRAVEEAVGGCAGIILQFPLYAGIMGLMHGSGLTRLLADGIAGASTPATLPLMTFLSAGVVNLFVPSGGGQWAVQGPIAIEAAVRSGVSPARIVMSIAYGDQLTNMLQPFWALPLLAITGARARDIVGYTAVVMMIAGAWIGLGLLAFPMILTG